MNMNIAPFWIMNMNIVIMYIAPFVATNSERYRNWFTEQITQQHVDGERLPPCCGLWCGRALDNVDNSVCQ